MSNPFKIVVEEQEFQMQEGDLLVVSFKHSRKKWQLRMAYAGKKLLTGTLYRCWGKSYRRVEDTSLTKAIQQVVENPQLYTQLTLEEYLQKALEKSDVRATPSH